MNITSDLYKILNDLVDSTTIPIKEAETVAQQDYPVVHKDDLVVVDFIKPDLINGPWIAGGAALAWYKKTHVTLNDIDVFCKDEEQMKELSDRLLKSKHAWQRFDSEFASTFSWAAEKGNDTWTIQVIKCKYPKSPQEIIDAFDISVCEVVTDGKKFVIGEHTGADIRNKVLRMKQPVKADAIKRFAKYYAYGYRPVDGLFDSIINNPDGQTAFEMIEEYNNVF